MNIIVIHIVWHKTDVSDLFQVIKFVTYMMFTIESIKNCHSYYNFMISGTYRVADEYTITCDVSGMFLWLLKVVHIKYPFWYGTDNAQWLNSSLL